MIDDSDRGGDFYDEDVTPLYLAHRHSGTSSPNTVMEEPAVLDQLGDLTGQRVLDLGCGDGAFAPIVLARGAASYLGIDGSPTMIDSARRGIEDPAADFAVTSIEDFHATPATFHLVTSRMTLHYIEDLVGTLGEIRRLLDDEGRLIFTVVHPVITSHENEGNGPRTDWTVDDYFHPGPRQRTWFGKPVTWHHRTVETYVRAVIEAGFSIDAVSECEPRAELLADEPDELRRRQRVPLMLLVAAKASPLPN